MVFKSGFHEPVFLHLNTTALLISTSSGLTALTIMSKLRQEHESYASTGINLLMPTNLYKLLVLSCTTAEVLKCQSQGELQKTTEEKTCKKSQKGPVVLQCIIKSCNRANIYFSEIWVLCIFFSVLKIPKESWYQWSCYLTHNLMSPKSVKLRSLLYFCS